MKKNQAYWICQLLGWMCMVTIEMVNYTFFIVGKFSRTTFFYFLLSAVVGFLCTHILRKTIARTTFFQKNGIAIWLLALFFTFTISFLIILIDTATLALYTGVDFKKDFSVITFLGYIINWMRYVGVWVIIYFMYKIMEQNNLLREEKLRIENDAKTAELELLKSQLNPHFLFNALNSIMALISIDPEKSRNAVLLLSDLLRFTLNYGRNKEIDLATEINETKKYFELEKIRFGDKLQLFYDIEDDILNAPIPPALVLTVAENAIKHSSTNTNGQIIVILSIMKNDHVIKIVIKNSGTMNLNSAAGKGIGLPLVKKRLEALYGSNALFSINDEGGMVAAVIQIAL